MNEVVKCINCETYPVLMYDFETRIRPISNSGIGAKYYYHCMVCGKSTPSFSNKNIAKRFWNEINKEV